ncbi:MAG TPA: hypothetical protein VNC84_02465 [Gammaproteobacteria bacterium]|nr:hypothetical protein [Gammaproteobacteria bacterium]
MFSIKRFQWQSESKKNALIKTLSTASMTSGFPVISLIGASRLANNSNSRLDEFIHSLIKKTYSLENIEVLIRIDDSDDLFFYRKVQKKYGNRLSIKYVVGPGNIGYSKLHTLVSGLLDHISPTSEIVCGFADDCFIGVNHWDLFFYQTLSQYPDNVFFINTTRDFTIPYENTLALFWLLWVCGPPALFTGVSRRVLNITQQIATKYAGWTAFGNSLMCDSFFESLQFHLWQQTGEKRAPFLANSIVMRPDIMIASHKEGALLSESPVAIRTNRVFLKESTQAIIQEMANAIAAILHHPIENIFSPTLSSHHHIKISILVEIKKVDNLHERISNLIDSLLTNTKNLQHIEVVLLGDEYSLFSYLRMKKILGHHIKISFHFYKDNIKLETMDTLYKRGKLNPQSEAILFVDEYYTFSQKHWDETILDELSASDAAQVIRLTEHIPMTYQDKRLFIWELSRINREDILIGIRKRFYDKIMQHCQSYCDVIENVPFVLVAEMLQYYFYQRESKNSALYLPQLMAISVLEFTVFSYENYLFFLQENIQRDIQSLARSTELAIMLDKSCRYDIVV